MDLRQLRYFTEVATRKNFRAAALKLHVSQSSLSRRVQELENELSTELFLRHAHGTSLTNDGQRLLDHAVTILKNVEEAKADMAGTLKNPSEVVTVATSPPLGRVIFPRLVADCQAGGAQIQLRLLEGSQYMLFEGLDAGRIDVAIMTTPEPIPSCETEIIRWENMNLVTTANHYKDRTVRIQDLDRLPLVTFPRPSGQRNHLDRMAREHGIVLDIKYEVADVTTQLEFAKLSLACCMLPDSAIRRDVVGPLLNAVPIEGLQLNRALVWRAERHYTPAVNDAGAYLRKIIRELY